MKNRILFFSIAFLLTTPLILFAISMAITSCSSDDEEETLDVFVPETNISEEIKSFFEAELPFANISEGFFTSENHDSEICQIINDDAELKKFYTGNRMLPSIDFSRHTLVIGKVRMENSYYYIKKQDVSVFKNSAVVNLFVSPISKEGHWPAFSTLYFWGLYPKFSVENISINKIKEL